MSKYRVAFYITNKTDEQSKKYNLDSQKSILHVWAEEMGWKWVKTYCEEISNKEPKKEKFQEMITDAKNGLFDGICITDTKLQNIPVKELLDVMNDLIKYGIKLHIYNLQHIDIYSDQGRFILSNLSTFNDFFKGQLATKIRAGIKKKMKKEWFGQAPYGYSIVSDIVGSRKKNTRLVENPNEQEILKLIKKLRDEGKSYNEISIILNSKGIPTRLKRNGNPSNWHACTVRNIFIRSNLVLNSNKIS